MTGKSYNDYSNERNMLLPKVKDFTAKIKISHYGEKTKALLEKWLKYCSCGEAPFGLFECPPVMERGKGAIIVDADNKEYLDFLSGFSVHALGHNNEEIIDVISNQSRKLLQCFGLINTPQVELSERLCNMTPGNYPKKVVFGSSGSEAIEAIMKLVRWYTGRAFILVPYGDYHGKTAGAQALTPKGGWTYNYPILPADSGVNYFPYPYCYRCPFDKTYPGCDVWCIGYLERLLVSQEAPFHDPGTGICNVASILIEPMQSSAGYIIPPKEYLFKLQELCKRFGILLAVDEIQCGMGRTGKMWACEHSDVEPDLMALGKALGGGLPISAVVARAEIVESWGPGAYFGTFSGNPLCCATALKTLEIIKRDNMLNQVADNGQYFLNGLRDIEKKHSIIGQVDGKGFYLSIEIIKDPKSKQPAIEEAAYINNEFLKEGLICENTGYFHNRFNLIPPLIISRDQLDSALEIIDRVIGRAEKKLVS